MVIDAGATNNTIGGTAAGAGNVIAGNDGSGVAIDQGATDVLVAGNWIGTDRSGMAAVGNVQDGVYLNDAQGVTIGGTAAGASNLISGNHGDGIGLNGATTTGNLIQGNLIGTDNSGAAAIGNTGAGVNDIAAADNTIGGPVGGARNVISGNAEGVLITGPTTGILVAGNLLGTDATGTIAVGNKTEGIVVSGASSATIGGTTVLARNVISGNLADGVDVEGASVGTILQGNYVGVDQTGTQPLGNAGAGISVDAAPGTTIGGTAVGAGNVISANTGAGVSIYGGAAPGIAVLGNLIGTDKTGTVALGNKTGGLAVADPPGVVIGGTVGGARNVISGNAGAGVALVAGANGELVQGNLIGTDLTGSQPLGNGIGVLIDGGSFNNTIGGTAAGAGNTIAFSAGIGVDVDATAGAGNTIRLNSIFADAGLGIDLGGDGVTLNTPGGPHTGPNDDQNFPVFTALPSAGGTTTVTGTFNSTPNTTFALDFYTISSINASGHGEGRYVLGSAPLMTDPSGNASFSAPFTTPGPNVTWVSATATDPNGNTSEFSQEFGTNLPPTAVIGFTTRTVNEGGAIFFDGRGSSDPDGDPLTYSWSFGDGGMATGATAIHIYRQPGTFTASLTVDDGFGATNTAQATVIVLNVPPSFVPGSYEPPLVLPTPSPGDGYGEAVASVNEAVAVGARLDTGGGAVPAGAVYLYDTNPDDTGGLNSIHTYGQLLHVFTDPNPAAGDLFGASVAAVGNNLLIGAPGSSPTGPGDGAAYLFDANPDSPTFGALLATFTVPNPDAAHQAQFGASVASAGTNVVIGAPGQLGGTGEVFVFGGDPTQPTFGSLLLDIASPTAPAAAHFGASVSGRGIDVLVGAPLDNTAGPGAGAVYLFNGTTGALLQSFTNPHPAWPGFGSAVASVGPNVLVGAPQDGTAGAGAGAAFLFNGGTGTLMVSLVQPDGGGGGFGTSVAGSGTTAFVGAPGSNLGQADAGAAYLFDADPTSPTFGAAIAVVGAPTPQAASSFGEAVAFSNQALVVGAAGAPISGTTGTEATYVYQPGVPLSLSSRVAFANGSNDSVVLSGTFTDPGLLPISATINWGDGSPPTVLALPFGSYAFTAPHRYTDDSVARYSITATLADHYGGTSVSSVVVAVSDPAPAFAAPGLMLSSSSIHENDTVTLSGTIVSPGGIDANTVAIDWGDGSVLTSVVLPPGTFAFSVPHTYLNQPAGVASGVDAIHATVVDEDGKIGRASTSITVSNVAPQFTASNLSLSETTANENDVVTLNGQFTDPGTLDRHTVTIDWGDGSPPTVLLEQLGRVLASSPTPGLFTYSATHQYADNPPGLATDAYDIHVSVADDVSTTSADQFITVNTVPPTVRIESAGNVGAGTVSLTAAVTSRVRTTPRRWRGR